MDSARLRPGPGPCPEEARRGFTLAETLVTLLVGLLLVTLAWRAFADVRRLAEGLARRSEALDAVRTARHVLSRELRAGAPLVLAGVPSPDSVGVRALRGVALVCPGSGRGREMRVAAEGLRAPDPAKDSIWIFGSEGGSSVLAIEGSEPSGPCEPLGVEGTLRWTLSGDVPRLPSLALFFERGSYHLSGAALRYRRGGGGRQPLTPELLDTPPSRFEAWEGSVAIRLTPTGAPTRLRSVMPFVSFPRGGA